MKAALDEWLKNTELSDVDEAMAEADRLEQSLRAEIDNANKQS